MTADQLCGLGGFGLRDHVQTIEVDEGEVGAQPLRQPVEQFTGHIRRVGPRRTHQRRGNTAGRQHHIRSIDKNTCMNTCCNGPAIVTIISSLSGRLPFSSVFITPPKIHKTIEVIRQLKYVAAK